MTLVITQDSKIPKYVPLNDLVLDSKNMRFRHKVNSIKPESEIEEMLFDEEDVKTLCDQILCYGGILQPLYVVSMGKKYLVKDGNRRTVALRRIIEQISDGKENALRKSEYELVPVIVLDGTKYEVDTFLGTIHVSGPREWPAANKARLVFELIESGRSVEAVAKVLGMKTRSVENYYRAFKATEEYGKRYPDPSYIHKFSFFAELFKHKILREWTNERLNLDDFIDWVGQKKLRLAWADVRNFAKIMQGPSLKKSKALSILKSKDGDIDKAFAIIAENSISNRNLWKTIDMMVDSLNHIPWKELESAALDKRKQELLDQVISISKEMLEKIRNYQNGKVDVR